MKGTNIISVQDLSVSAFSKERETSILNSISFSLKEDEILGIVGESGSGKSITALSILKLLPKTALKITSGSIIFDNEELTTLSEKHFKSIRGNKISMIFQEPMSALNPSMTCGNQVNEILKQHTLLSKKERIEETLNLFEKVKLPQPKRAYKAYPHEISGGQMQRVMIAMAITKIILP